VGGETYQVVIATNGYTPLRAESANGVASIKPAGEAEDLAVLSIDCAKSSTVAWKVRFGK